MFCSNMGYWDELCFRNNVSLVRYNMSCVTMDLIEFLDKKRTNSIEVIFFSFFDILTRVC